MPGVTDEVLSAKIEASEARTDAKFERVLSEMRVGFTEISGKLDTLGARVDGVERATSGIKATVIGTGIAVVGLVIAVLMYGNDWMAKGISIRDAVTAETKLSEDRLKAAITSAVNDALKQQVTTTPRPQTEPRQP